MTQQILGREPHVLRILQHAHPEERYERRVGIRRKKKMNRTKQMKSNEETIEKRKAAE